MSVGQSKQPLRALLVEDNPDDVTLTLHALEKSGFVVTHQVVETEEELKSALVKAEWDIVLSDYHLPRFGGPEALAIIREVSPDTPFILVSGTIGEDAAVDVMRGGAQDYILKGKLRRLGAAIAREVQTAEGRRNQRRAEAALLQSEELNRILLASSSDWVSILDENGTTRFISPPVERTLGYRPEELMGRSDHRLVVEDDLPIVEDALAHVIANPSESVTIQVRVRHKDGTVRDTETTIRNFLDDSTIRGLVASTRDISQRQAMEAERRARVVAEMANRTKSTFLANMSHELRTPLNAIIGFSELLEQGIAGPLTSKQALYVDNVLQSGRHLLSLVNDVLDLSKVEAGKLTLTRELTSLSSIASSIGETVAPLLQRSGVTFHADVPSTLPLLYVDPIRLKQILFNLVSNGIKFNKSGGEVRLVAIPQGRGVEISIRDTGIGIRPEDLPRLFREFERLAETSSPDGTGLGLALTRRLVELHGGTVTATSTVGVGSTFTIYLPDVQRPRRSSEPPSARGRHVLIVGNGADLDRVADGLVEAGANVERRPSIAPEDPLSCEVLIIERSELRTPDVARLLRESMQPPSNGEKT